MSEGWPTPEDAREANGGIVEEAVDYSGYSPLEQSLVNTIMDLLDIVERLGQRVRALENEDPHRGYGGLR